MRHDTDVIWPHLGHRFDDVGEHRGNAARFTCQASDLVRGHRVTLRVVAEHAPAFERDLFDREADGLARIGAHSAVVRLHERVSVGAVDVLVLQAVSRPDVMPRVLPPRDAVRAVVTLAGGVETAHRLGVLHGAIEPDAIVFDESGASLLSGFQRRLHDPHPPALHHATSHTPPEVLLGDVVGETADVYGLGSTLYELVAGHPAIRSYPGESPAALSLRVLTGAVTNLDRPGVPFELVDVLNWALSVEPGQRPPSVAWFAEELGRIERSQGWRHTRLRVGSGGAAKDSGAPLRSPRHRAG